MRNYLSAIVSSIFLSISICTTGQTAPGKYWVTFTDKTGTPYSIDAPEAFLSARALHRRENNNIEISEQDLPVNPAYTDSLKNLGVEVLYTSKWFNAATIYSTDTALLDTLHRLSFIKDTVHSSNYKQNLIHNNTASGANTLAKNITKNDIDYNKHALQLEMIQGHILHQQGFRGKGILIAVLDAGYYNADTLAAFDTLWKRKQVIGMRDFVKDSLSFFKTSSHGMRVLSIMAGMIPGKLIGSAPEASYYLIRSEDSDSENIIEGDNWIAAAELADSVGADIINSSLGYATFDDQTKNYSYSMMDGNSTRISRAADIAASKGILVVTSAGNMGSKAWKYITAPADADSVLAIGAVDPSGIVAGFSSRGPSADGRIKPDICALGVGTFNQGIDGTIGYGSGTSFSSPVIAGMVACLWQTMPQASNFDIIEAVIQSASHYQNPDTLIGFGIPDFVIAKRLLYQQFTPDIATDTLESIAVSVFPNPIESVFYLEFNNVPDSTKLRIKLTDTSGRRLRNIKTYATEGYSIQPYYFLENYPAGAYILNIKTKDVDNEFTLIKR